MSSVQQNSNKISTNLALIQNLQQEIIDLSNNIPDLTNYARLDISNTFVSKQTFLDTINAEKVVADKFFTDNNGEELVYGNYSNTFYVNDGETGTSGSINDTLALITSGSVEVIRISAGSYSEDVLVSGKELVGLSCPNVGGTTMTELVLGNTFTIENSLRVRVSGLQINGMTTISGSQLRHRLEVCNFNGGLTITGGGATPLAEFMTIQDCDVAGSLTISAFTGIVYFYRVNFQNATFNISPAYSSQQVIMIDCAGIPDDASLFAGNYFAVGLTSFYKSGSLTVADLNPAYYVRNTSPSQDNELASKIYVDTAVATNTSAIATNTLNISTNTSNISTLQGFVVTNTININDLSLNKQDVLTAGDNITIVNNVISSSGGGGGSSAFVGFKAVVNPNLGLVTVGTGNISTYFNDTSTLPYSYDTNGLYDTSTGIFTANTNGYWQISFKFYIFDGEATQAQTNQLKLIRSGVESALFITGLYNGQNDEVNTCCPLLVGDQIYISHATGTTRYVLDTPNAFFEARYVGTTISTGSSIEIFQASMVRDDGTTALSNNDNLPFVIIDKETSGLTMSASNGEITFGGSNVAGTYEIKYSLVVSNIQSTTARVIIRGYVNDVWVVEFGKLSGLLENGSFTYDFADGDVLKFSIIGLQSSNQLLLATGLTTETYASCFLTGIKLI